MTHDSLLTLPAASVLGMGAVTRLGRTLDTVLSALSQPSVVTSNGLRVPDELLQEPSIATQMRRADRFGKMSTIAAADAWSAAVGQYGRVDAERVGLILSSGFGAHVRGFRFIDGLLDNGDAAASPTDFSHSVHGAASAYISRLLDIRGPSLPLTDFETGFEHAIGLALCWLSEKTCERVLVGAVEELGDVLVDCAGRMLGNASAIHPGEGAAFFVLGPQSLAGVCQIQVNPAPMETDLLITDDPPAPWSDGLLPHIAADQTVTFSDHFGQSSSAAAFDLLGGVLAMRARRRVGRPVERRPSAHRAVFSESADRVDNVCIARSSSDSSCALLQLTRSNNQASIGIEPR